MGKKKQQQQQQKKKKKMRGGRGVGVGGRVWRGRRGCPAEPWTFDFLTELSHLLQKQTFKQSHPLQIFCCMPRPIQPTITHSFLKQVWQLQKIKLFVSIFLGCIIFRPFYFISIIQSLNMPNNPAYLKKKKKKKKRKREKEGKQKENIFFYKLSLKVQHGHH